MEEELVDIVDETGKPTGNTCSKRLAHKKGYLHPTVHIWILNATKEILLQQRVFSKDTFPGLWDVSVAGHIAAGEVPISAALREIQEEVGLQVAANELIFIGTKTARHLHTQDLIDHELHYIYLLQKAIDFKNLSIQKEEVADIKMIAMDAFKLDMSANPQCYVPHGKVYYDFIFKHITKLVE